MTKRPVLLSDILSLKSVSPSDQWTFSANGRALCVLVGMAASETGVGTSPTGGEPKDAEVYFADLTKPDPKLRPLTPGQASLRPSFSPCNRFIAHAALSRSSSNDCSGRYTEIFRLKLYEIGTGESHDLGILDGHPWNSFDGAWRWLTGSKLLVRTSMNTETLRDDLASLALQDWHNARFDHQTTVRPLGYDSATPEAGTTSLKLWDLSGGDPHALWDHPVQTNSSFSVAPDGRSVLVQTETPVTTQRNFTGYGDDFALLAIDAKGPSPRKVDLAGQAMHPTAVIWSHDATRISVFLAQSDGKTQQVGQIDTASGQTTTVCDTPLHLTPYANDAIFQTEDGDLLVWASPIGQKPAWHVLNGRDLRALSGHPALPGKCALLGDGFCAIHDGKVLLWTLNNGVFETNVMWSDAQNPATQITWPLQDTSFDRIVPAHGMVAFETRSGDIFALSPDGECRPMDMNARTDHIGAVCPETASYLLLRTRSDGQSVDVGRAGQAQTLAQFNSHMGQVAHPERVFLAPDGDSAAPCELLLPSDVNNPKPWPTVLFLYPNMAYPAHQRTFVHQAQGPRSLRPHLFTAAGYAVLMVGSRIDKASTGADLFDQYADAVSAAVKAGVDAGFVDPDQLFAFGHSAGGHMTAGLLCRTNKIRAAIAMSGLYDPASMFGVFGPHHRMARNPDDIGDSIPLLQNILGSDVTPWSDAAVFDAASVVRQVTQINTPLMIVHGGLDYVPIQQAEQLYSSLRYLGKETRFLRYEAEGHILSAPRNVVYQWACAVEFFNEYKTS